MIETRKFLSQRQWLTVEKFADVFIEGQEEVISPGQIATNISFARTTINVARAATAISAAATSGSSRCWRPISQTRPPKEPE